MASPQSRDQSRRDRLHGRLGRLREDPAPADRRPPRFPPVAWLAAAAALVLIIGLLYRQAAAPPPAMAATRAGALPVRLLAVTRTGPHQFAFSPLTGLGHRLFSGAGDAPISAAAEVPPQSVTLWLWAGQPGLDAPDDLLVTDSAGRTYRNSDQTRPLVSGALPWGRATLVWVALTDFDRTASAWTFRLRLGGGEAVLPVAGPSEPPAEWQASGGYPLLGGTAESVIRVWHVRRVDPPAVAELLADGDVPPPHDQLLMADIDVSEPRDAAPGSWLVSLDEAVTPGGEQLRPVAQRAGLAWLAAPHRPLDVRTVRLQVSARKVQAGSATVVFGHLDLPSEVGQVVDWARAPSDPDAVPFRLACRRGAVMAPGQVRFTLEGDAPAGSQAQLEFIGGLDDQGGTVEPLDDEGVTLFNERRDGNRVRWQWSLLARVAPQAGAVALQCKVTHRAVTAETAGTFIAPVLPPRRKAEQAGIGLLLKPAGDLAREGGAAEALPARVAKVLAGSRAATAKLAAGDLVLAVDELPPGLMTRILARHAPGDRVPVLFRRGGKLFRTELTLDPLVAPAEDAKPGGTSE